MSPACERSFAPWKTNRNVTAPQVQIIPDMAFISLPIRLMKLSVYLNSLFPDTPSAQEFILRFMKRSSPAAHT
jgi:hypothetical protein